MLARHGRSLSSGIVLSRSYPLVLCRINTTHLRLAFILHRFIYSDYEVHAAVSNAIVSALLVPPLAFAC